MSKLPTPNNFTKEEIQNLEKADFEELFEREIFDIKKENDYISFSFEKNSKSPLSYKTLGEIIPNLKQNKVQ